MEERIGNAGGRKKSKNTAAHYNNVTQSIVSLTVRLNFFLSFSSKLVKRFSCCVMIPPVGLESRIISEDGTLFEFFFLDF